MVQTLRPQPSARDIAQHFEDDCWTLSALWKQRIRYNAGRFNQMLRRRGGIETARRLLRSANASGPSSGFRRLQDNGMLALSLEALALRPWYDSLFTGEEKQHALDRLVATGFDMDAHPRESSASPSLWHPS